MEPLSTTWCTYCFGIAEQAPEELLDTGFIRAEYRAGVFMYPMEKGYIRKFNDIDEWYAYVKSLRIRPYKVALPYIDSFDEALHALFMTYLLPGFCKMAEMKALSTLEGALKEAYRHKMCKVKQPKKSKAESGETFTESVHRCAGLADCLEWAEKNDGLEPNLFDKSIGSRKPQALNVIRDKQMHGKLEEMFPWGGLFDVIKSTIEYAFRNGDPYDITQMRMQYASARIDIPDSHSVEGRY